MSKMNMAHYIYLRQILANFYIVWAVDQNVYKQNLLRIHFGRTWH